MCTVTFIPQSQNRFILTSNRDESPDRVTILPDIYTIKSTEVLFPKDEVAGGTWIGASDKKRVVCLLNGGFTAHERKENYRMSRGIIVTDLLTAENAREAINNYNFEGIEPFTIILVDFKAKVNLYELVWDEKKAYFSEKPLAPQIWSSSLLYTEEMKNQREEWFSKFLMKNPKPSDEELLEFHKTTGRENKETGLVIDRGLVATKSITQLVKNNDISINMKYEDLRTPQTTKNILEF